MVSLEFITPHLGTFTQTSRQTNEQRGHCGLWEKCIIDEGSYVYRQSISMAGYFTKGES